MLVPLDPGTGDRDDEEVASWLGEAEVINPHLILAPTQVALVTTEKPIAD